MELNEFETILVNGNRKELIQFGNSDHCAAIDWRDELETILNALAAKLPRGVFEVARLDDERLQVRYRGESHALMSRTEPELESVLQSINRILVPDYEMRILKATMGDGYSLLLRPAEWWRQFESNYPDRLRTVFITVDHRVEQTGTGNAGSSKRQHWWSKLLGRNEQA